MKARSLLIAFALISFGFHNQAHAGLLLEPYLGYASGTIKQSSSSDFTGSSLGARVGFSILGFAAGVDYDALNVTDDSSPKDTITGGNAGVFLSYKFPVLFRVYATYVPTSELSSKASGSSSVTISDGTSSKIGIGYTGFPLVNLNVEAFSSEYGKGKSGGISGTFSPKLKVSGFGLSVSMPFDLL